MGFACSEGDESLSDQELEALVERVLTDLDLPGSPASPSEAVAVPDGELEFGFHCHIQSAGFEIDEVLVAFPSPAVGHQEFAGGDIERVEVALLAFDSAESATAVQSAYEDDATADCLAQTFSEPLQVEPAEPVEASGVTAEGFVITIGTGEVQVDGHRTYVATVGRVLVEVSVLAPDQSRGKQLAGQVFGTIVDALKAGDA